MTRIYKHKIQTLYTDINNINQDINKESLLSYKKLSNNFFKKMREIKILEAHEFYPPNIDDNIYDLYLPIKYDLSFYPSWAISMTKTKVKLYSEPDISFDDKYLNFGVNTYWKYIDTNHYEVQFMIHGFLQDRTQIPTLNLVLYVDVSLIFVNEFNYDEIQNNKT